MKRYIPLLFLFIVAVSTSCSQNPKTELSLILTHHQYYANLSSASGIATHGDNLYLVGDDLPWLFKLDKDWALIDSFSLAEIHPLINGRTESAIKADFENLEIIKKKDSDVALVLSSGSKKDYRDTAFLVTLSPAGGKIERKNIRPLYEKIKIAAGIVKPEEINIEGLAISESKAYLFHRGNISGNFIVEIKLDEFMGFIDSEEATVPEIIIHKFDLPVKNGVASGFSGACMLPNQSAILFTASMEDTETVTEDGVVSGSYVGTIPVVKMASGDYQSVLLMNKGTVLAKKLEGVAVKSQSGNKYNIITVCDNDDGSSDIFELELKIHQD